MRERVAPLRKLKGEVRRIDPARPTPPRMVKAPFLSDYIPGPRSGIWEPMVGPGADVSEGDLIGRVHDFADRTSPALDIRAHKAGVVIAMYFAAVCKKGLTVYV